MKPPRPGAKGLDLEEALRAYFLQSGYFVARGLPYRLDGEDVTDIDLWLYERPAASTRRRLLVDIKNKRSPKAAERIIWAKGLQAALGVDGAIVATTDNRTATRRLAKALGVTLLDGDAIAKLTGSAKLRRFDAITSEELNTAVKRVDEARHSTEWRQVLQEARASLVSGLGVQSANKSLSCQGFFGQQALNAQPGSPQAEVATRLVYLMSAMAAVSLDFMLADHAFRSGEDRRAAIINGVRYGHADVVLSIPVISAAVGLARKYAENGTAVAKRIETGFRAEAEEVPAEIIADHFLRLSGSDAIFNVARDLEASSSAKALPPFDRLSTEEKSTLGAFLDFNGVSREKFASAWNPEAGSPSSLPGNQSDLSSSAGPLFRDPAVEPEPTDIAGEAK